MMRRLRKLAFLSCFVLVACGTTAEPQIDTAKIERGVEVYRVNYCGSCHTLETANTRGTFGPGHDDAGSVAAAYIALDTYSGEAATAEGYIRESLLEPTLFYTPGYEATNHHMPAFGHLPEEDIDALVYLLVNQREE